MGCTPLPILRRTTGLPLICSTPPLTWTLSPGRPNPFDIINRCIRRQPENSNLSALRFTISCQDPALNRCQTKRKGKARIAIAVFSHKQIVITNNDGIIEPDGILNGSATSERNPIAIIPAIRSVLMVSIMPEAAVCFCVDIRFSLSAEIRVYGFIHSCLLTSSASAFTKSGFS